MLRVASLILAVMMASASARAGIFGDDAPAERSTSRASAPKVAGDGISLRKIRRAAIGASAAGTLGLVGVNLELCLSPLTSFIGGYGLGDGYTSFALGLKRVMGGDTIMPYGGAGFARWANGGPKGGAISETTPTFLSESFLSDDQKRTGAIAANMFYGSLGLQWLAPSGSWAGSSFYVEAVILAEISRLRMAPTAGLGYLYYF